MPHTLDPFRKNHALSFEQLFKPVNDTMVGMSPLESQCSRPLKMRGDPLGISKKGVLRPDFDRNLRQEFHGSRITSDARLIAYRELDEVFGLTESTGENLLDWRSGRNTQHTMTAMLRQSVFGRLAEYEDTNDAERLSVDPAMRTVVGGQAKRRNAASVSQMSRFEAHVLTSRKNIISLMYMTEVWIDRVRKRKPFREIILDMYSSASETHGNQEGSAFNRHFRCNCYHPLFCFNQHGDLSVPCFERAMSTALSIGVPCSNR